MGPVRFISSVEIPKNQPSSTNDNLLAETTNSLYKTVVISGGEGYEEYKILNNSTVAQTNNSATTTATNNNQELNQPGITYNTSFNQASLTNMSLKNSPTSTLDENYLGKDDIFNYVLTWEI